MQTRSASMAAMFLIGASVISLPAFAAGDGGGDDTVQCKAGQIYDKAQKKCVPAEQGKVDDDSIYETGRDLAMKGRFDEAIKILTLAADKTDPRILNYLGYSHRKSGRVLVGLGYYQEALRNDPDYTLVREYMGEAHLQLGDVAAAREQLGEIEKRCGKGCAEYAELSAQIAAFVKG